MTDDPRFARGYKHLHGAPHHPDPGPWPYLAVMFLFAAAAVAIIIATYI